MKLVKILEKILVWLSRKVLNKYQPTVIGIGGSVGKTLTKEVVASVIELKFKTGKTIGSFNTELGVMGIILTRGGDIDMSKYYYWSSVKKIIFWIKVIIKGIILLFKQCEYPEFLVLELGEDKPGDIDYLVNIVKPKIGIITAMGEIPAHVGFYNSPEQSIAENAILVNSLPSNGLAILNADDENVINMKYSSDKMISFSMNKKSDYKVEKVDLYIQQKENNDILNHGIKFSINNKNFILPNALAKHQVYAFIIGTIMADHFNIDLDKVVNKYKNFILPGQRMSLKQGTEGYIIIDDSYNSSPIAAKAALTTLNSYTSKLNSISGSQKRRVAILGDMLELGKYGKSSHHQLGENVVNNADLLLTVGKLSDNIAIGAIKKGFLKENIYSFENVISLKEKINDYITPNDIVLVKASRSIDLKQIVDLLTGKNEKG